MKQRQRETFETAQRETSETAEGVKLLKQRQRETAEGVKLLKNRLRLIIRAKRDKKQPKGDVLFCLRRQRYFLFLINARKICIYQLICITLSENSNILHISHYETHIFHRFFMVDDLVFFFLCRRGWQ